MTLLSIDPGVHGHGVAEWVHGELQRALYVPSDHEMAERFYDSHPDTLVIEVPQVYRQSKGDPNDLIDLAFAAGVVSVYTQALTVIKYRPREWKGQVPKEIMAKRIQQKLSVTETQNAAHGTRRIKASLMHNVWDAVGIGLYYLGRLGKANT